MPGRSTGDLQVQIQPEVNEDAVVTMPVSEMVFTESPLDLGSSGVLIRENYDKDYLNPDLEALINQRGFSTLRPEVLGLFNYLPPLSAGNAGATSTYNITSAGELFDYQCQLKQLRYTDVLLFLEQMLGFKTTSAEYGINLTTGVSTRFASTSDQGNYLQNFERQMKIAKDCIDYLYTIYTAVSAFIQAIELEDQYKIFLTEDNLTSLVNFDSRSLTNSASTTNYNNLLLALPLPTQFNGKWNSVDYKFDDSWSMSCLKHIGMGEDWILGSSSTSKYLQLLNFVAASLIGLNPSYNTITEGDSIVPNGLLGVNNLTQGRINVLDVYPALKENQVIYTPHEELSDGGSGVDGSIKFGNTTMGAWNNRNAGTGFNGSDVTSLYYGKAYDSSTTAFLIYLMGLDVIQGYTFARGGELGGVNVHRSMNIEEFVGQSMGRDVSRSVTSILYSVPHDDNNLTKKILITNEDADGSDNRKVIESLTSTNADLASGVEYSRSGRSYFCDEITTLELDEAIGRLNKLNTSFNSAGQYLRDYASLLCTYVTTQASQTAHSLVDQWGYMGASAVTDAGGNVADTGQYRADLDYKLPLVPSTYFMYLLNESKQAIARMLIGLDGNVVNYAKCYDLMVCTAAAEDDEIAFMLGAYLIKKYEWQYQDGDAASLKGCAEKLMWAVSQKTLQKIKSEATDNSERWSWALWGEVHNWGRDGTSDEWGELIQFGDKSSDYNNLDIPTDYFFFPSGMGKDVDEDYGARWLDGLYGGEAAPIISYWDDFLRNGFDFTFEYIGSGLELAESILIAINDFAKYQRFDTDLDSSHGIPSARGFNVRTHILIGLRTMLPFWNRFIRIGPANEIESNHVDTDG